MRVETRKVEHTTIVTKKIFIAVDGTEFDYEYQCREYERDLSREKYEDTLLMCKDAEGFANFDGADNSEEHNYTWVFVRDEEDAKKLMEMYPIDHFYDDYNGYIGEWICIEESQEDIYVSTLNHGINYVKKLLDKLGYNCDITAKEEVVAVDE